LRWWILRLRRLLQDVANSQRRLRDILTAEQSVSCDALGASLGYLSEATREMADSIANWLGVDHVNLTSMGSTTNIYVTMTYISRKYPGSPVLCAGNSHMSWVNAAANLSVPLRFVSARMDPEFEAVIPPGPDEISKALEKSNAAAVVITTPTYEGLHVDVASIVKKVRDVRGDDVLVIVDNAWGWGKFNPVNEGADIAIRSTHKMEGALMGASVLLANTERIDRDLLVECGNACYSTSQSCVVLASIGETYCLWARHEAALESAFIEYSQSLKNSLAALGFQIFEGVREQHISHVDPRKITIKLPKGIIGYKLSEILQRKYKLIPEKAGISTITLIVTARTLNSSPEKIADAIARGVEDVERMPVPEIEIPLALNKWETLRAMEVHQAVRCASRVVDFDHSAGLISASVVVPYPPGIPLIIPGQRITEDIIRYLHVLYGIGGHVVAADPSLSKIRVVEEHKNQLLR